MITNQQQKKTTHRQKSNLSLLFKSSLIGVWRGLVGLPFQHPFDNIKTNMQAYQTNFKNTFNGIYKKKGILGFYSGFLINSLRIASKQVYRWPLQIGFFGIFNNLFGQNISRTQLGMLCGLSMSLVQVIIICPFERIKVWLMTARNKSKTSDFFKKLHYKALFDGILPVFMKQSISWITYLGATQYLKQIAYKLSDKNRFESELNSFQIFCVSSGVALINTFFVMPVDCLKTNFQKNNEQMSKQKIKGENRIMNTIKMMYKQYGLSGFYKGWQVKLVQYSINSLFTVLIFQKMLKEYEKNNLANNQKN